MITTPDIVTSTTPNIARSVMQQPVRRSLAEAPLPVTPQLTPMTSQVAEEEEEEHFYTAGVIPQVTSISEKVAQVSGYRNFSFFVMDA